MRVTITYTWTPGPIAYTFDVTATVRATKGTRETPGETHVDDFNVRLLSASRDGRPVEVFDHWVQGIETRFSHEMLRNRALWCDIEKHLCEALPVAISNAFASKFGRTD